MLKGGKAPTFIVSFKSPSPVTVFIINRHTVLNGLLLTITTSSLLPLKGGTHYRIIMTIFQSQQRPDSRKFANV